MIGLIKEVDARYRIRLSPDQISKSLASRDLKVSHGTIYQYLASNRIAGGDLSLNLRINGKRRYRRRIKKGRREKIPNLVDIASRAMIILEGIVKATGRPTSSRERWEAVSCSRAMSAKPYREAHLLLDKSSAGTMRGIVKVFDGLTVHSITYDNGLEFAPLSGLS
jgi:IS30 family transposase